MFRSLLALVALSLTVPALAAMSPDQLDDAKAEVKYAKDASKNVSKLAKKWHKNSDKDKNNAEIEEELRSWYRQDLGFLRAKGVKTVEEPDPPKHPAYPTKVVEEPQDEQPRMEALRDVLVELKKGDIKDKAYGKKLDGYVELLESRYERKNERYKVAKKAS